MCSQVLGFMLLFDSFFGANLGIKCRLCATDGQFLDVSERYYEYFTCLN